MSNARNKRPAGPSEDEPNKKRGRPTNDELDALAPEDSVSRVQTRRMLSRRSEIDYTRQDESSFYHDLMPWPETYEWSDEDDAAVAEEWQQSEIKEALKNLDSSQHNGLLLLFKISLRLYRILPTVLLSPVTGMRYTPVYRGSKEWIMSHKFCESLSKIMVHPCWEQDIDLLALALRWAVICRLDSRLKWCAGLSPFSCPVIQKTLDNIEGCEGSSSDTSYHEMHKAERERASERGESLSILSDILYELGEEVSKEPTSAEEQPGHGSLFGWSVLPVTQWDLDAIVNVVNKLVEDMYFKPQWNYSVEDGLAAWKAEKAKKAKDKDKGTELPLRKSLSRIYRLSYEIIFKWLRLQERQSSPMSSDEAGDEQSLEPYSDNDGPRQATPSPPHQTRRRTAVDGSSDVRSESGSENPGPLQVHHRHDDEEEGSTAMRSDDYELSLRSLGDDEDDDMTDNLNGASFDSGDFPPQATNESDRLRPHGTTLAGPRLARSSASPVHSFIQETRLLSELSEIRNENKELRDGQKEQRELLVNMKKQLDSVQSELSQLRQAKEAPTEESNVQRLQETPTVPDAADTGSVDAAQSPELGTTPSSTSQLSDFEVPAIWRTAQD